MQLFQAPATTLSLILNPAPAPEGKLNPFSIRRSAGRCSTSSTGEFIAQRLLRGSRAAHDHPLAPSDYDFLTVYDIDRGSGIRYDPEYARQQIIRMP